MTEKQGQAVAPKTAKHTPGPWEFEPESSGSGNVAFLVTDGLTETPDGADTIALVTYSNESEANARLIAAAPDLLAALQGLLPMWESGIEEPWVVAARSAIAKATGE